MALDPISLSLLMSAGSALLPMIFGGGGGGPVPEAGMGAGRGAGLPGIPEAGAGSGMGAGLPGVVPAGDGLGPILGVGSAGGSGGILDAFAQLFSPEFLGGAAESLYAQDAAERAAAPHYRIEARGPGAISTPGNSILAHLLAAGAGPGAQLGRPLV